MVQYWPKLIQSVFSTASSLELIGIIILVFDLYFEGIILSPLKYGLLHPTVPSVYS